MKVLFVFEFGLLHYRLPILERIAADASVEKLDIMHTLDHSNKEYGFTELKVKTKTFWKFKLIPEVNNLLDKYDVIVFSFNLWRPSWFYALGKPRKAKYILWGQGFGRGKNYLVAQLVRIYFAKWADALIFYTPTECARFTKHGIPREKMFVAQNTLHISNAAPTTDSAKTDLLYVGRIQKRKGLDDLLRAFAMVKNEIPDAVTIRVVGDAINPEDKTELQHLTAELGLEQRVTFEPGVFDDEALKEKFANSIAYVSPNHVGLGVVHSFAYGVPVITNKTRKHAPEFEYCNDENSVLYEGELKELAASIKLLCNNPTLQKQLGQAAYQYYDNNLRVHNMVNGFLDSFHYALNEKSVSV
ncbi:glycosyltransferase family 4 protein [Pontibacter arcticus]|uniref:Glycosyl transferase family 1 domain-containing protein n=1 Tax=Pontibacter arcticus TaxID=2080288 RepID=A0A364RE30_9BACT|nr:glycosyltransferase family 4 protein [Pontibacter arcticus]RAU82426.1 hypothetical protein DP923_11620 [Pontibacter arcticus]